MALLLTNCLGGELPTGDRWHLDAASRRTFWGVYTNITIANPYQYQLVASHGNQVLLYQFLQGKQQADPAFARVALAALQDPSAPGARDWRKTIQAEYDSFYARESHVRP